MANDNLILLVEDNPDDEVLTLRAFRKSSIPAQVVVVRDGAEALDFLFGTGAHALRDTRVQPRVILLDLNLPKLGGLEVLARLRSDERTRFVPVVVLTSSKQDEDLLSSYSNGANAYLHKTVDFDQFSELLKVAGGFWLLNEQAPAPPLIRPSRPD